MQWKFISLEVISFLFFKIYFMFWFYVPRNITLIYTALPTWGAKLLIHFVNLCVDEMVWMGTWEQRGVIRHPQGYRCLSLASLSIHRQQLSLTYRSIIMIDKAFIFHRSIDLMHKFLDDILLIFSYFDPCGTGWAFACHV